eukprot:278322-Prorocentrum_minimum.AAC.1
MDAAAPPDPHLRGGGVHPPPVAADLRHRRAADPVHDGPGRVHGGHQRGRVRGDAGPRQRPVHLFGLSVLRQVRVHGDAVGAAARHRRELQKRQHQDRWEGRDAAKTLTERIYSLRA